MCTSEHARTHTCTHTRTCTHTYYKYTHVHTHTHMYAHTYVYTHILQVHTCTHTHTCMHTRTCTHTYYKYTHTHTTYTHTHTCTQAHTSKMCTTGSTFVLNCAHVLFSLPYNLIASFSQTHEDNECERRPVPCSLCGVQVALNAVSHKTCSISESSPL